MRTLWIAVVLLANAASVQSEESWYAPKVGQPHPDFLLPTIDTREAMSLSQHRGQRVLLIQFASW